MAEFKVNDQRSLIDQLRSLIILADHHGLYDAADYIREKVTEQESRINLRNIKGKKDG